jgi:hypothetical protein
MTVLGQKKVANVDRWQLTRFQIFKREDDEDAMEANVSSVLNNNESYLYLQLIFIYYAFSR